MNSRNRRAVMLAVVFVFLILEFGYVVPHQKSFAGSLGQNENTKNPLQPTDKNIALGLDHFDAHCAS